MSNPLKKSVLKASGAPTNAKQRGDLNQRMDVLETRFSTLGRQLQASFGKMSEQVGNIARVVDAISEVVGVEEVSAKTMEMRVAELEAEAAAETAAIDAAIASGELEVAETISATSYVVTQQNDPEGKLLHPSRVSIPLDGYKPEIKEQLVGKKVGDSIELADRGKLTVLQVLEARVIQPTATSEGVA